MAFCPECGKAVTPDAAVCVSCGKQLRSDDKKARAARFHGTMMITAPEVKAQAPANINGQLPVQQEQVVAAAAGMKTSPRLGAPVVAKRSNPPPSTKQSSNQQAHVAAPTLGRSNNQEAKATMMGPGVSPAELAQAKTAAKAQLKNATMIGAGLAPTIPRSKPPAAAAKHNEPAVTGNAAESGRPQVVRPTTPQNPGTPSVRAVQSVPVSPAPPGAARAKPAAAKPAERAQTASDRAAEAPTVATPLVRTLPDVKSPDPARMVQAIPEVVATVIDPLEQHNARTVPREYLPGDPMAPQPSAAARAQRPRPFAPDEPEEEARGNYILLYWAVCVAVVAAVSALAFRLF